MERNFIFHQNAFDDFFDWSLINKAIFKKIYELLKEIRRSPFDGKGKPEPLKHDLKGYWSRRITDEHRLIYKIDENQNIIIISCKGHYSK